MDAGQRDRKRLAEWQRRALPSDRAMARSLYQNWLRGLANRDHFHQLNIESKEVESRRNMFTRISFTVHGHVALADLTQFLYEFYSAGHLQQIRLMDIKPLENSQELDVNLTIEALSLPGADRKDQLSKLPGRGLRLAKLDDYREPIAKRDLLPLIRRRSPRGLRGQRSPRTNLTSPSTRSSRDLPKSTAPGRCGFRIERPAKRGSSARDRNSRSAHFAAACGRLVRHGKSSWISTAIAAAFAMAKTSAAVSRSPSPENLWKNRRIEPLWVSWEAVENVFGEPAFPELYRILCQLAMPKGTVPFLWPPATKIGTVPISGPIPIQEMVTSGPLSLRERARVRAIGKKSITFLPCNWRSHHPPAPLPVGEGEKFTGSL